MPRKAVGRPEEEPGRKAGGEPTSAVLQKVIKRMANSAPYLGGGYLLKQMCLLFFSKWSSREYGAGMSNKAARGIKITGFDKIVKLNSKKICLPGRCPMLQQTVL